MTTLDDVAKKKQADASAEAQAAAELVRLAQEQGLSLTGPDGLLKQLTKTVLETALNEEMTEHLGYEKHDPAGAGSGNIRNDRAKTVLTDTTGPVELDVPRDRAATFESQIVKSVQRRSPASMRRCCRCTPKGLTTGEISAHFAEIYGASVSRETISRITDKVTTPEFAQHTPGIRDQGSGIWDRDLGSGSGSEDGIGTLLVPEPWSPVTRNAVLRSDRGGTPPGRQHAEKDADRGRESKPERKGPPRQ